MYLGGLKGQVSVLFISVLKFYSLEISGFVVPSLPTQKSLFKHASSILSSESIEAIEGGEGVSLDVNIVLKTHLEGAKWVDEFNNKHVQVLGDGVHVTRGINVVNIAVRSLEVVDFYNSLSRLQLMYVTLYMK